MELNIRFGYLVKILDAKTTITLFNKNDEFICRDYVYSFWGNVTTDKYERIKVIGITGSIGNDIRVKIDM